MARATFPSGMSLAGGKHCSTIPTAVNVGGSASCTLGNVVAGHTIIAAFNFQNVTTYNITATESLTCPGATQASQNIGGFIHQQGICFVALASNHSSFNVSANVGTIVTGTPKPIILDVWEFGGLGAVDAGSEAAANANTVNFTTAANNEFVFTYAGDLSNTITPSVNDFAFGSLTADANTQDYRQLSMFQNPSSGSHTTAITVTGAFPVALISTVSFAISGGSPEAAVHPNQQFQNVRGDGGSGQRNLNFYNTLLNSKGVFAYMSNDGSGSASCAVSSGETCTCPTNSQISHTYSIDYSVGVCYVDFTSAHSGTIIVTFNPFTITSAFFYIGGWEMVGLNGGADVPSEAAAAANTVNYTTTNPNEYTFSTGTDSTAAYPANLIVPGNSFVPAVNIYTADLSGVKGSVVVADKITTSSGTNTWSWTTTGSTSPMIATISFTPIATAIVNSHVQIIRYRIPWDRKRRNEIKLKRI